VTANLPTRGLDVLRFADHVLGYVQAFFATNNVALPARQYIAPGLPALDAWDCEQFMVGLVGVTNGGARQGQASVAPRTGAVASVLTQRQAIYGIQLVRCAPRMDDERLPDPAEVNTAGRAHLIDAGLLSQAIVNLASDPPDWFDKAANIDAGQVTPMGPAGGYAGIEANVTITAFMLMTGDEVP
jgi:hypothetical protein